MSEYIQEIIKRLEDLLPEYLALQGVQINEKGFWKCFMPDHNDNTPSAHLCENKNTWHCFGCGATGSIFHAASILEGLPRTGKDFVFITLSKLCQKLGVPYLSPTISPHDLAVQNIKTIIKDTTTLLPKYLNPDYALNKRMWTGEVCGRYCIGTVKDFGLLKTELISSYGYSESDLQLAEVTTQFFSEDKLTILVRDHFGDPVGFVARQIGDKKPKYVNPSNRQVAYNKRSFLFGLDMARTSYAEYGFVYLVEGYGSVLAAQGLGINNVVACGGTSLTEEQLARLKTLNMFNIVLCFDHDKDGQGHKAMKNILKARKDTPNNMSLAGKVGVRVSILDLEPIASSLDRESMDMDDFCSFHKDLALVTITNQTSHIDAFSWILNQISEETHPEDICDTVMPLVVNEGNNIRRELMIKSLSERTGVREIALQRELDDKLKTQSVDNLLEIEKIREDTQKALRTITTDQFPALLEKMIQRTQSVQAIRKPVSEHVYSHQETLEALYECRKKTTEREDLFLGYPTGYTDIDNATDGIPKEGKVIVIAGRPNAGKSSLTNCLALGLVRSRQLGHESLAKTKVLIFSTDDSREDYFFRMMSILSGVEHRLIRRPQLMQQEAPECVDIVNESWTNLAEEIRSGMLDIKDSRHGSSLEFLLRWVDKSRDDGSNAIVFIDSFHKIRSAEQSGDQRIRFKELSEELKSRCVSEGFSSLVTCELRKTNNKKTGLQFPTLDDLAETNQIAYDANLVLMYVNPLNDRWENANQEEYTWVYGEQDPVPKPIVQVRFEKNKLTGFKGDLQFRLDPYTGQHLEVEQNGQH